MPPFSRNFKLEIGNWKLEIPTKSGAGFTLIEIVLSIFLILGIVSIMLSASGTYLHSRGAYLASTATKIASCEVEQLRSTSFTSITNGTNVDIGAPCNGDISKLPAPRTAKRTIVDYGSPPDPDIKQVTINVTWTVNNATRQIKIETLISENGI